MQTVSKEYKKSISQPLRNRGYIKVTIGVVNSDAQKSVSVEEGNLAYFANPTAPLDGIVPTRIYGTCEKNFSKVDGSMYFLPPEGSSSYYNNGIVTEELVGSIYFKFETQGSFDIKGLVINFGDEYPTILEIENDTVKHRYANDKAEFTTEDVFDGTTFIIVRALRMRNEKTRMRIYNFTCGIANVFTNNEIISFNSKEYVSPITETVPSQDTTVVVDNQNLYYSPDNAESALAYMEIGQEIKVAFGYDVDGKGKIEWLPETTTYLKTWSATDVQAKFTGTDRFDYLTDKYYDGHFYKDGITLYDLAIDVLTDAGITDTREYFLDNYLKKVKVYNPLPIVTHAEALQIIANAGRCALSTDRQKRIHIQSSFVPDMNIRANNQTDYSNVKNVLNTNFKEGYAVMSNDFSIVDGSLLFIPENDYLQNVGYVSESIADADGIFNQNPIITVGLESIFEAYGLTITFRNVAPQEFVIRTYNDGVLVEKRTFTDPDVNFITNDVFLLFNSMEIEFTKGYPNSRIFIDNILVDNVTDYTLRQKIDLTQNYTATRKDKIKSINVERTIYSEAVGESVELKNEEIDVDVGETEYTVYFTKPSYEYSVETLEEIENEWVASDVSVEVVKSNNYYIVLRFTSTEAKTIKYVIKGKEYVTDYQWYIQKHNDNGIVREWRNPLISSVSLARDLEEWLATYFLGDVEYNIPWRGDPRTDANDLYYLETKSAGTQLIRGYENTINFNGVWSSTIKARRAALEWQSK